MLAALGWMALGALLMLVGLCALAWRNLRRRDKRVVMVQVPAEPQHDDKMRYADHAVAVLNGGDRRRRRVVESTP